MSRPPVVPPTDEPLDTLVFRPLAARLVRLLAPTSVTPNQVSVAGALAGFAAAACLVCGHAACAIGAPLFLLASLVLDVADGQLARARAQRSYAGWVMDILADGSKGIAVFTGLAIALGRAHGLPGLVWGVAAGASVLMQVLTRDHSLHRFERETGAGGETEAVRHARIEEERRRLRAGPLTLARVAMAIHDLVAVAAAPFARERARDASELRLGPEDRERRLAAQGIWRHLGGTAQLVTVSLGAAAGRLLPAATLLVVVGNAVLVAAALLEWRDSMAMSERTSAQSRSSGTSTRT